MPTILDLGAERPTVRMSGRACISTAQEAHERLSEALSAGSSVDVDLSELTDADASLLQLLVSARASAEARGLELAVRQHGYAFENALRVSGLEHLLEASWVKAGERVQFFFFDEEEG